MLASGWDWFFCASFFIRFWRGGSRSIWGQGEQLPRQLRAPPLVFVLEEDVRIGPGASQRLDLSYPLAQALLRVALVAEPDVAEVRGCHQRRRPFLCIRDAQGRGCAPQELKDVA